MSLNADRPLEGMTYSEMNARQLNWLLSQMARNRDPYDFKELVEGIRKPLSETEEMILDVHVFHEMAEVAPALYGHSY